MAFEIPAGLAPDLYPLAWLIGEYEGTGLIGHAEAKIPNASFGSELRFTQSPDEKFLTSILELRRFVLEEGVEKFEDAICLKEESIWRVLSGDERPESLTDDKQHAVECISTISLAPDSLAMDPGLAPQPGEEKGGELVDAWRVRYVGVSGYGKLEMLSDEIEVLAPEVSFINDLYRSSKMFGNVNNRLLWAWDIAILGEELSSFASAGQWKV